MTGKAAAAAFEAAAVHSCHAPSPAMGGWTICCSYVLCRCASLWWRLQTHRAKWNSIWGGVCNLQFTAPQSTSALRMCCCGMLFVMSCSTTNAAHGASSGACMPIVLRPCTCMFCPVLSCPVLPCLFPGVYRITAAWQLFSAAITGRPAVLQQSTLPERGRVVALLFLLGPAILLQAFLKPRRVQFKESTDH